MLLGPFLHSLNGLACFESAAAQASGDLHEAANEGGFMFVLEGGNSGNFITVELHGLSGHLQSTCETNIDPNNKKSKRSSARRTLTWKANSEL